MLALVVRGPLAEARERGQEVRVRELGQLANLVAHKRKDRQHLPQAPLARAAELERRRALRWARVQAHGHRVPEGRDPS